MATMRGNTAYQIAPARAPKRARPAPRPAPLPDIQKKHKPRLHVKAGVAAKAKPIALVLFCCVVAVVLLMRNALISGNSMELHKVKAAITTEQKTNNDLRLSLASEENLGRVMEEAAAMGMAYPSHGQIREIEVSALADAGGTVQDGAQAQHEPSGVQKFFDNLFAWLQ